MTEKSAIQKMVEWLKKRRAKVFVWNENYVERQSVLKKAQELAAEEAKAKPEAPASLVERIAEYADSLKDRAEEKWNDDISEDLAKICREFTAKPTADKGLVDELSEFSECCRDRRCFAGATKIDEILSRYTPAEQEAKEEPLAVLAMRKGFNRVQSFRLSDMTWTFWIDGERIQAHELFANTYAEAEAKARKFLLSLEDKV